MMNEIVTSLHQIGAELSFIGVVLFLMLLFKNMGGKK